MFWSLVGFRCDLWPPILYCSSLLYLSNDNYLSQMAVSGFYCVSRHKFGRNTNASWLCILFWRGGGGVQLVSMWRADGLMKIDSNYVEPRLTARNDDEGRRILMSFVRYSPLLSWRHTTNTFRAFFIQVSVRSHLYISSIPNFCSHYLYFFRS